ncbi:hypothetical protein LA080_007228 [Diaporthe eres]|nr:hypothetical protein LA080_007228 [Diaporthe eres]
MASHFRAWLRSRLKLGGKTRCRAFGIPKPQTTAPSTQEDSPPPPPPPPPYTTIPDFPSRSINELPSSIDGSESLEVLRARNPATRPPSDTHPTLRPPRDEARPVKAAQLSAQAAVIGMICALYEPNPMMVAARTAQAIAMAVSTSRSYAAFVAAVTAAESSALLLVEDYRDFSSRERLRVRQTNALDTATDVAMAADAGITPIGAWPFNIHDTFALTSLKPASPLPD